MPCRALTANDQLIRRRGLVVRPPSSRTMDLIYSMRTGKIEEVETKSLISTWSSDNMSTPHEGPNADKKILQPTREE